MNHNTAPTPVPCVYRAVQMRSRLEARWAAFFDALQIDWEYEPSHHRMKGQKYRYTPDFQLPDLGVLLEVKPHVVMNQKLVEKYLAYGPHLVAKGACRIFVFVIGSPRENVDHAALWKYGERTFSFDRLFGEEAVRHACLFADRTLAVAQEPERTRPWWPEVWPPHPYSQHKEEWDEVFRQIEAHRNQEAHTNVAASIKEIGFKNPIVVDEEVS